MSKKLKIEETLFGEYESPKSPEPLELENALEPIEIPLHSSAEYFDCASLNRPSALDPLSYYIKNYEQFKISRKRGENVLQSGEILNNIVLFCKADSTIEQRNKAVLSISANDIESISCAFLAYIEADGSNYIKLIELILALGRSFINFGDRLIGDLEKRVFTLNAEKSNQPIDILTNLTTFFVKYTLSVQANRKKSTCRLFIYKALYYSIHRSFPIIHAVLTLYPQCLPTEAEDCNDALILAIKCILMNSPKNEVDAPEYKKVELRRILTQIHRYQVRSPALEEVVADLVKRIHDGHFENVSYSLILLSKRYGFEWAHTAVIKAHLYPILNENLNQNSCQSTDKDIRVTTCIFVIASIVKTSPFNTNISSVLQTFSMIALNSASEAIQEAAIQGLLQLSRFGFIKIYQKISLWRPTHQVSSKTKAMLKTFISRKPKNFWMKLIRY